MPEWSMMSMNALLLIVNETVRFDLSSIAMARRVFNVLRFASYRPSSGLLYLFILYCVVVLCYQHFWSSKMYAVCTKFNFGWGEITTLADHPIRLGKGRQ